MKYKVSAKLQNELSILLDATSPDMVKNAKLLAKGFQKDAKFNRWLDGDFTEGLTAIVNDGKREQMFKAISQHGYTSVKDKQALCIAIIQGDVDAQVERKNQEVTKGLTLDNSQKEKHAVKLVAYKSFIEKRFLAAIKVVALDMGVLEETAEVKQPSKAALIEA